jgi:hypothetical protein
LAVLATETIETTENGGKIELDFAAVVCGLCGLCG